MKIYIHTDIEGVAGWVFFASWSSTAANLAHLERMNRLLTREVNAAAVACREMGATEVYVNDSHGSCYNILFEALDPCCRIIHGRNGHSPSWLPLLDASFDAAIAIGMHARAGTEAAVCPHSYWHLKLGDGRLIALSECAMFAALAGERGVPVVAVSGDDKIAVEMESLLPGCERAVVKQGLAPQNACALVPERACACIAEKVKAGLVRRGEIQPLRLAGPYQLNVSDRDPAVKALPEDVTGTELWAVMHEVCRRLGNRWGDQGIDDKSWRYPESLFN